MAKYTMMVTFREIENKKEGDDYVLVNFVGDEYGSKREGGNPVQFTAFGERAAEVENLSPGDVVEIEFYVRGRVWKDRTFVSLTADTIVPHTKSEPSKEGSDGLPF